MRNKLASAPRIGISWKSADQNYDALKEIIRLAGGEPVELEQILIDGAPEPGPGPLDKKYAELVKLRDFTRCNAGAALEDIDGVILTGGGDISPELFASPEALDSACETIDAARDVSDYLLAALAMECDIPSIGICRGEQIMGVVAGGEYIQDMAAYYRRIGRRYDDSHRMPEGTPGRTHARHDVLITRDDSWMRRIVGGAKLKNVPSWHHQALLSAGNMVVTAVSRIDGVEIIEAVEAPEKRFFLGVQFHPERDCQPSTATEPQACDSETCLGFFRALVSAAKGKN